MSAEPLVEYPENRVHRFHFLESPLTEESEMLDGLKRKSWRQWYEAISPKGKTTVLTFDEYWEKLKSNPDSKEVEHAKARMHDWFKSSPTEEGRLMRFLALLDKAEASRFVFENQPTEPVPRFLIHGVPISTPGNLTVISAQAKHGKTAILGGFIAAVFCAAEGIEDQDTLGVSATAPGGKILIHLDTEQAPFHSDAKIRAAGRRAGVKAVPEWLWSFSVAGYSAQELRELVQALLWRASAEGGVFAMIVDGAADLVVDVNDAADCNTFVAELHGLAIKYDCPIVGVIHENPGSEAGKTRGHLGSQLERKAESNLRLRKKDEVTTLFSEKQRGAPILESTGPRFAWSNADGMHMSVGSAGDVRDDAKREKARDLAESVFAHMGKTSARHSDLLLGLQEMRKIGASAAEDRFTSMKKLGVITKCPASGLWTLNPVTP